VFAGQRRRLLRLSLATLVVLGCAYLLSRQVDDLASAIRQLSASRMGLSAAAAIAGTVCIQRLWFALLTGFGVRAERRDAAEVFYVSQLGKYVPGSVWPMLAQMQLGDRWGAPRRVMLGANILLLVVVTTTGILVGGLLLPWSSPDGLRRYWWLLALLPPLFVLLHPRAVIAAINWLLGRAGREPLDARVSTSGLARALMWAILAWGLLGIHLLILMTAYGPVGPVEAAAAVGGIGLAWAAGLAFIPAPAGAGVREAVLVLTLGPFIGAAPALAVALASRVLLLLADVVLAGAGVGLRRLLGVNAV
jgi:glycosyltransferase 2 family protein